MSGNSVFQRIEYLSVIGGFLDGLHITFSAGLNTIIGARGTGKTTVVECLAYALDTLPSSDHAPQERKRVETLIKRNLNGGRIEVGIRALDGTAYRVTRSFGDDPIVLDADGVAASLNLKAGLFRTDVYGQNAVESIADRPLFQLDLIDSFASESIQQIASREKQLVSLLLVNAHQMIPLEQEVGSIQEELAGLPNVEQKLKGFAGPAGGVTAEVNEAHRLKGLRDRESRLLQRAKESLAQVGQSLRQLQGGLLGRTGALFDAETSGGPNSDLLQEVTLQWQACGGDVDRLLLRAIDRLATLDADLSQQIAHLAQRHRQQELAFRTTIEKHQQAQHQAAERSALEKQRNHLLSRQFRLEEVQLRIGELRSERMSLLRQLCDVRDERFAARREVAGRINTALSPTIRISISQYGNTDLYRAALESRLKGSGVKQSLVAQKIATALTPTELAEVVRARDTDSLIDRAELSHEQAGKVAVALADQEFLYGLEAIELGDQPLIELKDGEGYKDTSSLSTGQKCTTILPILLLDSDNPLIIDQPEDNLDNRFIFENVVKSLRRVKQQRQLILVTHNPNIPVLGDAEQVIVLDSDGTRSRLIKEGGVDGCKDEIVTLLEGGAEAFRKRGERYGKR
ncbi:AAA family ATPase [Planctomicrobium sp. SH661]|uniref:AAA family ATPase n=1 Tax=Planctomicrobium sp. SH661 TaxID=3448124 RepID=UPI003F5BDA1D